MMIVEAEAFFILGCYVIYSTWLNKCDDFESKDKKKKYILTKEIKHYRYK